MLQSIKKTANGLVALFKDGTSYNPLLGRTNGLAVPSGYIGEELINTASISAFTTNTYADAGQITLTPGIWEGEGMVEFSTGTAVVGTQLLIGYGSSPGNSASGLGYPYRTLCPTMPTNSSQNILMLLPKRYIVDVNTIVYLKARVMFSANAIAGDGALRAVRIA